MKNRDEKRTSQCRGGSLEQGKQGPDCRQRLTFIMGCQRLGELTELSADDGALTTDVLDQGSDCGRALCWQTVFSHELPQHGDQTSRARVQRDTGEIRQYGSVGVPVE